MGAEKLRDSPESLDKLLNTRLYDFLNDDHTIGARPSENLRRTSGGDTRVLVDRPAVPSLDHSSGDRHRWRENEGPGQHHLEEVLATDPDGLDDLLLVQVEGDVYSASGEAHHQR